MPAIIKGAGGRLDIPLLNAIKEASAVNPYAPIETKKQILDTLAENLKKAQANARNKVNILGSSGSAMPQKNNAVVNYTEYFK